MAMFAERFRILYGFKSIRLKGKRTFEKVLNEPKKGLKTLMFPVGLRNEAVFQCLYFLLVFQVLHVSCVQCSCRATTTWAVCAGEVKVRDIPTPSEGKLGGFC